jgi:CBS domain-containing protein
LAAANNPPLNVHPDSPLSAATTIMQLHDFSQLPVLANERTVRGIIS